MHIKIQINILETSDFQSWGRDSTMVHKNIRKNKVKQNANHILDNYFVRYYKYNSNNTV